MARKKGIRRTKGGRVSHLVYDYKYLYKELFGEKDSPLNLVVGKKVKRICVPRGKLRAFVRVLNEMINHADHLRERSGRKLWDLYLFDDKEYDIRNVKFRRSMRHYALFEYAKRKYPSVIFTDTVLAVMAEKLDIPFYLIKNTHKSWKEYKHKVIGNPKKEGYMPDEEVEKYLSEYDKMALEELFG